MKITLITISLVVLAGGLLVWGVVQKKAEVPKAEPQILVSSGPGGVVGPIYFQPPDDAIKTTCDPTELTLNHGEFGYFQIVMPQIPGKPTPEVTNLLIPFYDAGGDNNFQRTLDNYYGEVHARTETYEIWPTYMEKPYRLRFDSTKIHAAPDETVEIPVLAQACAGSDCTISLTATCLVKVKHAAGENGQTSETSQTPVTTEDGFKVIYSGPTQVRAGGQLAAKIQVLTPEGKPARGKLNITLGDPPTDPHASHTSAAIDADGRVNVNLDVKWPVGKTKLHFTHAGKVYAATEIDVNQYGPGPSIDICGIEYRNSLIGQYNMYNELRANAEVAAGRARRDAEELRREAQNARQRAENSDWMDRLVGNDDAWNGYAQEKETQALNKEKNARYWDGVAAEAKQKADDLDKQIRQCK